ncbi:sensor histidine kinase [Tepidibacter formicigenes]|uniref:Two-component system, LytT family, sensor kinase n=1 Tax=Tepidibacter formicigenes DSM 15518 TaxID=1123349 RepID=A0A1M6QNS5_9FIRM|nr:sensor histidine kinase [Tepidibacter formicigenes]SHK21911.1 two-component system, LytT family, sensor kinase [Tepidibacter formicigenes DSM 15518]
MIYLLKNLINNSGYVILIAFLISKIKSFKKIVQKDEFQLRDLIILSLIFGAFGILGTYIGTDVRGAIANTRIIGVMAGGILCGPLVGILSGIIAGLHRYLIDIGGITSLPCLISTITGGYISGIIYKRASKKNKWIYGILGGILVENLTMILILLISKPFELAILIVKDIYIPMTLVNGIGIGIVILITESIFEEKEEIAGRQAKLALEIANKTLPYFRDVNNDSLKKVCEVIKDSVGSDAVSITDRNYILAHVGLGEDHHVEGERVLTESTEKVISSGDILILKSSKDINCPNPKCPLKSAIIAPLKDREGIVGALKIYYGKEDSVTFRDETLAIGLSHIISTQLEIGKLERIREMANKAEIKALQAQINPHFLFNALNTIVSFVRINPNKARELIINLSTYLRHNLEIGEEFIDINKELDQVKAYIEIEKARFGDKLNVIYDIQEDINIKIPNLIIQPLVENSIKHGILKGEGKGTVKIKIIKIENNKVKISIEDDGIGISQDIIRNIYKGNIRENKIGLSNVHNRLKLIYGKGVNIERLDKGTKISFIVS